MQLWVVKLNIGVGRALEHTALLEQENSVLASEDSALSSGERVEQLAAARGMVPAPPGALHFDKPRGPLDVRLAVAALARPLQRQTAAPTSTAGTEAGSADIASTEAGSAASTETSASAATNSEAAGAGTAATSAPAAAVEGAAGTLASTAPVATPTTATVAPTSTGGSSEAASAPAGSGGGTQAPGG
jgi:hypothetical protein